MRWFQVIHAGIIMLAMVASARGQAPTPKPDLSTKQIRFHKYINHQYSLSFWYPDTYRITNDDQRCKDTVYERALYCSPLKLDTSFR